MQTVDRSISLPVRLGEIVLAVALCGAGVALVGVIWLSTQQPKVWCNREWAGICLLKGGYRSWSMRFCDGETWIDGKFQTVVITTNGFRKGYFRWPRFGHVDARKLQREIERDQGR